MTPTQGSTRYSSAGNSGYDDDFEADADELDADLDFGGQVGRHRVQEAFVFLTDLTKDNFFDAFHA